MTLVNIRDDTNMNFAFSVRSKNEKRTLLDPRYVKIITTVSSRDAEGN